MLVGFVDFATRVHKRRWQAAWLQTAEPEWVRLDAAVWFLDGLCNLS
jgi:hypothetical protein